MPPAHSGTAGCHPPFALPCCLCCIPLRRQRLVWEDSAVVNDLLKKGLFMRIYEPQVCNARCMCFRDVRRASRCM